MNGQGEWIGSFSFLILSLACEAQLLLWWQGLQSLSSLWKKSWLKKHFAFGSECCWDWIANTFPLLTGIRLYFTFSLSPTARSKTARPSSPTSPFSLLSPSESETIQVTWIANMKYLFWVKYLTHFREGVNCVHMDFRPCKTRLKLLYRGHLDSRGLNKCHFLCHTRVWWVAWEVFWKFSFCQSVNTFCSKLIIQALFASPCPLLMLRSNRV